MPSIKGTQTEKNLLKSFAGESQARNRYTFFASVAEKEGYPQISRIFIETADNERQHAKLMFSFLEGGPLEITATYPAGKTGTTEENLLAAAGGENEEHTSIYPSFAETAKKEGFNDISVMYQTIGKVEQHHEQRYHALAASIKNKTVWTRTAKTRWICDKCGHVHEGTSAPNTCPCCKHPQKHFYVLIENY